MARPPATLVSIVMFAVLALAACGGAGSASSALTTAAPPAASAAPATPVASTAPSAPVDRDYGTATAAPTAPPASPPAAGGAAVSIASFTFAPGNLTISVGTTVTWTNSDSAPHSVKSTDGGFVSSGTLRNGGTYSLAFPAAGTFPYVCGIHPSMQGTVTVGP